MKLYEISADMRRALHALEVAQESGDAHEYEAAMTALSKLEMDKHEKLGACCAYYRELEAEIAAIDAEVTRLQDRQERAEKRLAEWREYIGYNLGAGEQWKNEFFKLSWRKSTAVAVSDEKAIPELYWRVREVREIDKKAIAEDLRCGATIPGAALETRQHLQLK